MSSPQYHEGVRIAAVLDEVAADGLHDKRLDAAITDLRALHEEWELRDEGLVTMVREYQATNELLTEEALVATDSAASGWSW